MDYLDCKYTPIESEPYVYLLIVCLYFIVFNSLGSKATFGLVLNRFLYPPDRKMMVHNVKYHL